MARRRAVRGGLTAIADSRVAAARGKLRPVRGTAGQSDRVPRHDHDVFVSYSRADSAFAHGLHDALVEAGKDVYVDWEDIPSWSPDWQADLDAAIDGSDLFVLVVSRRSLRSAAVASELRRAVE